MSEDSFVHKTLEPIVKVYELLVSDKQSKSPIFLISVM